MKKVVGIIGAVACVGSLAYAYFVKGVSISRTVEEPVNEVVTE